jgi:NADPH:quinone reductase-like Zn-dependent oxidoreductase
MVGIAVRAIGVNFADVLARQGLYPECPKPPVVLGYEVAGVVYATGTGVTTVAQDQSVLALTHFGGYADRAVVPEHCVFPLPPQMPWTTAAALPVNYLTAYLMLYHWGRLQAGEHVLIHGAAGGVGLAAVQLARLRQAEIYGTAATPKHAFLHEQGVQHTIDYYHHDVSRVVRGLTGGRGVDMVLDPLGGHSFTQSYHLLAPLGRLLVFGISRTSAGPRRRLSRVLWHLLRTPWFHPLRLMRDNKAVIGVHLGRLWAQTDLLRDTMQTLLQMYSAGQINPVIAQTFPLAAAPAAHRYLQERRNIGKVLLTLDG